MDEFASVINILAGWGTIQIKLCIITTRVDFNGNQFYTLYVILLWPTRVNQELYIEGLRGLLIDRKIRHALDLRVIHVGGVWRSIRVSVP
jgi:hypothetical protein